MRQQFSVFTALFSRVRPQRSANTPLKTMLFRSGSSSSSNSSSSCAGSRKIRIRSGFLVQAIGLRDQGSGQTTQGNGYLRVYVGYEDLRLLCRVDHILAI